MFSQTISLGSFLVIAAIALAAFLVQRRDERYKIVTGERNEYRDRASRLATDLEIARADIRRLEALPNLAGVENRLEALLQQVEWLQRSIDVHEDPSLERRVGQAPLHPGRRRSDERRSDERSG